MKIKHQLLHELLTVQYATVYNLFSYTATTLEGSLVYATKKINEYLKKGWICQIPFDQKPRDTRKQYFYYVTKEGANAIGRPEDYKQKITKSISKAEHESIKIDIALSFLRNYPDYEFDFNYKADLNGLRPDIFIKARNLVTKKEYVLLVEIERKKEFSRVYREKIPKYKNFIANNNFIKKNSVPVLFVLANLKYDAYLRPQHTLDKKYYFNYVHPKLQSMYTHLSDFINEMKNENNRFFRFILASDFEKLGNPICLIPNGPKIKILP